MYFHESIRATVSTLGNSMTKEQLDSRRKRKYMFESILKSYNDELIIEECSVGECDDTTKCEQQECFFSTSSIIVEVKKSRVLLRV